METGTVPCFLISLGLPNTKKSQMVFSRFRFTLRVLLVGVTLLAILFGFKSNQAWKQRRIVERLKNEGASIRYRYQYDAFERPKKTSFEPDTTAPWLARFLGIDFCSAVVSVSVQGSHNPDKVELVPNSWTTG